MGEYMPKHSLDILAIFAGAVSVAVITLFFTTPF